MQVCMHVCIQRLSRLCVFVFVFSITFCNYHDFIECSSPCHVSVCFSLFICFRWCVVFVVLFRFFLCWCLLCFGSCCVFFLAICVCLHLVLVVCRARFLNARLVIRIISCVVVYVQCSVCLFVFSLLSNFVRMFVVLLRSIGLFFLCFVSYVG